MRFMRVGPAALAAVLILRGMAQAQDRAAPPSAPEQAEAEKAIKDVFKAEYAKRTPADRLALAKKLHQQGVETKDDLKIQFVLFREAREIAAQAGDSATALLAIDEMAKRFVIDATALRSAALAVAAKSAKTPEEFRALAVSCLAVIDAALGAENFEGADKFSAPVLQYAKKSQDVPLIGRVSAKVKEIGESKSRFEKLRKARETLAASPDDAPANLLVGRFLVVTKGDLEGAIPLLAKGDDATLAELAKTDLSGPTEAEVQVSVGDGWWNWAEKEPSPAKERLRERAGLWYSRAFDRLAGLHRARVEKRLVECRVTGVLKGTWQDVTDGKLFDLPGKSGEPLEAIATPGSGKSLKLQFPKGEFDGATVKIILDPAKDCSVLIVYDSPHSFAAIIDTPRGFLGNFKGGGGGWDKEWTDWWKKEPETVITILVQGGEFVLFWNGQEKHRVKTTQTRLRYLALEANGATVKFDQVKIRRAE